MIAIRGDVLERGIFVIPIREKIKLIVEVEEEGAIFIDRNQWIFTASDNSNRIS